RGWRLDLLCVAALQATVDLHLMLSLSAFPAIALLHISEVDLRARAAAIADRLEGLPLQIAISRGKVKVGGGTLPKSVMSSVTIDIVPGNCSLADFAARLRTFNPPVIGYIANERFKLDLRTIFAQQDDLVVDAVRATC